MPGATASGSDAQGGEKRQCTPEQAAAVRRIKSCHMLAFYDILDLEAVRKTCTESDIKKAYRKQSLLTHPDKNSHEHAVQAFQMVSRAFDVLGNKDKRDRYDRDGLDPDSRFSQAQAQNPFSGFASRAGSGMGGGGAGGGGGMNGAGMWDDEISPEEMFQRFFGGGGGFGGPFGGFDTGPQFVFNFGGGPGIRVHQFGGGRPRRRPRAATGQEQTQDTSIMTTLIGLLPILVLFIFPLLSSIFSGSFGSEPAVPRMVFDHPQPPLYTAERTTPNYGVRYFVNPRDVEAYTNSKFAQLDKTAETYLVRHLQSECENEMMHRQRLVDDAQGWFFQDPDKMQQAQEYQMPSCQRLDTMRQAR